jgi:hypothetical protein
MSAHFVGIDCIDALLTHATIKRTDNVWIPPSISAGKSRSGQYIASGQADQLTEVGKLLLRENMRSLFSKYGDRALEVGIGSNEIGRYRFNSIGSITVYGKPVEGLKLCDYYDYQSRETRDYQDSEACRWINWLRTSLVTRLPGWADAPWGYERSRRASQPVEINATM